MTWAQRVAGTAIPPSTIFQGDGSQQVVDQKLVGGEGNSVRLPTTKEALSRAAGLDPKERDQLRLHVQLQRKAMRQEKEKELEAFRHEQMLKRWESGNTAKPSKVIFLSDVVVPTVAPLPPPSSNLAPRLPAQQGAPRVAPPSSAVEPVTTHLPTEERKIGKQRLTAKKKKPTDVKMLVFTQREEAFQALVQRADRQQQHEGKEEPGREDESAVDALLLDDTQEEAKSLSHPTVSPEVIEKVRILIAAMHAAREKGEACQAAKDEEGMRAAAKELTKLRRAAHNTLRTKKDPKGLRSKAFTSDAASQQIVEGSTAGETADRGTMGKTTGAIVADDGIPESSQKPKHAEVNQEVEDDDIVPTCQEDEETRSVMTALVEGAKGSGLFHPTLDVLRVGQHPLAEAIDRRSKLQPVVLDAQGLQHAVEVTEVATSAVPLPSQQSNTPGVVRSIATSTNVRFVREYVVNVLTDELDSAVFTMLQKLVVAQKKLHDTQPQYLKARMRYCTGLRETLRGVLTRKVKLLLIAPDVEPIHGEDSVTFLEQFEDSPLLVTTALPSAAATVGSGSAVVEETLRERALDEASAMLGKQLKQRTVKSIGLDGSIRALVTLCRLKGIPFIFCMGKKRFAYAMKISYAKVSSVAILSSEGANDEYRAVVKMGHALRRQYQSL